MSDQPVTTRRKKPVLQSVRIRMYRQGLGDCFLLTFTSAAKKQYSLLIDCGVLPITGGDGRLAQSVQNILAECGGHINTVVATHQHADHISGFSAKTFSKDGATGSSQPAQVDQVWLAWTENPADPQVQQIIKKANALSLAVAATTLGLDAAQSQPIRDLLLFAGADFEAGSLLGAQGGKKEGAAPPKFKISTGLDLIMDFLRGWAPPPLFLEQKDVLELPKFGVKIYCLGPSRRISMLGGQAQPVQPGGGGLKLNSTTAFMAAAAHYAGLALDSEAQTGLSQSDINELYEQSLPFSRLRSLSLAEARQSLPLAAGAKYPEKLQAAYRDFFKQVYGFGDEKDGHGPAWRRIDNDWLQMGGSLALQQVSTVNNTSLVLAIELSESRKVLLFAADAEEENWQTWGNDHADLKDLLRRTVVYKVGHHGSINATDPEVLKDELTNPELVALIPSDVARANIKGWKFPDPSLYDRSKPGAADKGPLFTQTHGRIILNCVDECRDCSPDFDPGNPWPGQVDADPSPDRLWVDYTLSFKPSA